MAAVHIEILNQLGGNKFLIMTGSHHLSYSEKDDNFLQMHLTRNKAKAEYLKIVLEANDTYTMIFSKAVRKFETIGKKRFCISETLETVEKISMVYCDMLQSIFTKVTGLYTKL